MTHDEIMKSLENIKDELENILANVPDDSKNWAIIETLLATAETTIQELQ